MFEAERGRSSPARPRDHLRRRRGDRGRLRRDRRPARSRRVGRAAELGERERRESSTTGGTILPGLIKSHAHLAWDGIHDLALQSMYDPPEISAYKAAGNMLINLRAGVTTVPRPRHEQRQPLRQAGGRAGHLPRPAAARLRARPSSRPAATPTGCCREASGADEMRRAVRDQVQGGADLIKIMACHDTLEFTDEELEAVIDEAHRNRLPITAHATYDACIKRVVRVRRSTCVEHGGSMSEETIRPARRPRASRSSPPSRRSSMQSQPEIARKFNIPEWKIAERQQAVADPKRYAGLVAAAKAGVADRLRHRLRQPGRRARRHRAGAGLHGQGRRQARQPTTPSAAPPSVAAKLSASSTTSSAPWRPASSPT